MDGPRDSPCFANPGVGPSTQVILDLAFVVSEVKGTWGKAEVVPGTVALNTWGDAEVTEVSCASAGNCSAGGFYSRGAPSSAQTELAFVVSEVDGKWGLAEEVPGTAALDTGGQTQVSSVSCASAGNCSAGGTLFVVSEVDGTWAKAEKLPGGGRDRPRLAAIGRDWPRLAAIGRDRRRDNGRAGTFAWRPSGRSLCRQRPRPARRCCAGRRAARRTTQCDQPDQLAPTGLEWEWAGVVSTIPPRPSAQGKDRGATSAPA